MKKTINATVNISNLSDDLQNFDGIGVTVDGHDPPEEKKRAIMKFLDDLKTKLLTLAL